MHTTLGPHVSYFNLGDIYLILHHLEIKNLLSYRRKTAFLSPGVQMAPTDITPFIFMIFHL